jgi:hypothetical protein
MADGLWTIARTKEALFYLRHANGHTSSTLSFHLALPRCREVRYSYFIKEVTMLAKKTSKNQVTLPKKALQDIPDTDYFDVTAKGGVLILRPVTVTEPGSRLATVRQKIKDLGIEPKDLDRAITWARGRRRR